MPAKVIDASALAAVLFGEPAGREISERVKAASLLAPTLLRYEVGSVCLKKMRHHPDRKESLLKALAILPRMDIREVEISPIDSTGLADREGLTVYDAAYLWLARSLGAELVTLDSDLERASRR